jgi:hypothetical protein
MDSIERCVLIKADPHDVWEVLADFEGEKDWNPLLRKSSIISEKKSGPGAERYSEYEGGWKVKERIIEYAHGRRLCETAYEGMPMSGNKTCFTLEPKGDGTDVTWDFEYEFLPDAEIDKGKFRKYAAEGIERALLGLREKILSKIPAV